MELPSVDPEEVGGVWNIGNNTFRGFAAYLSADGLAQIRSNGYVKYVEEDSVVSIAAPFYTRQDYGQVRINQRARNLNTNNPSYSYANSYPNQNLDTATWDFVSGVQRAFANDGSRSSVCIIDTGIRATHQEFVGRVAGTINYISGESNTDLNGHGTHVAGSCCGQYRGVAPNTRIYAAKVLNAQGSGTNANVISGINWCAGLANDATRTWVLNLSLGGALNTAVNNAINAAATGSIASIPVVAAGNDNGQNACTKSPASASNAITVAASDRTDTRASFTNIGECVNVWAPGVNIHSAWITSDTSYNTISGTSMASPLVAGTVAGYGNAGAIRSYTAALDQIKSKANANVVVNCPAGTPNLLVCSA